MWEKEHGKCGKLLMKTVQQEWAVYNQNVNKQEIREITLRPFLLWVEILNKKNRPSGSSGCSRQKYVGKPQANFMKKIVFLSTANSGYWLLQKFCSPLATNFRLFNPLTGHSASVSPLAGYTDIGLIAHLC
jgi:hypothetical protein